EATCAELADFLAPSLADIAAVGLVELVVFGAPAPPAGRLAQQAGAPAAEPAPATPTGGAAPVGRFTQGTVAPGRPPAPAPPAAAAPLASWDGQSADPPAPSAPVGDDAPGAATPLDPWAGQPADPPAPPAPVGGDAPVARAGRPGPTARPGRAPEPYERSPHGTPPALTAPGKARKRRRGSARFAGVVEEDSAAPQAPAPGVPDSPGGPRAPRGARFAGVEEVVEPVPADVVAVDDGGEEAVAEAVGRLARLRAEGRSGEAHVLLAEAARWPAGRLPLLADALHRAGLGADWVTLLWEAAALPAEQLVAAAGTLTAAGRDDDGRQLLRQGVARPAEQIGAAVLRLDGEGREREARALLDAYVRVRTPEEAARCVAADPGRLVPLLLRAALGVSDERHWDLVHALRVAGHTA
ncbi:hypothetical protein L0F81_18565, partial [Streptomyces tricolor]|nr:hypothetical protein [Streptomyces tricolor]